PPLGRAREHLVELLVVEREPDVVDPWDAPVARLHDDVHRAALELREAELEPEPVELLPRDAGLVRQLAVADPPVPRDEPEPELPDVPRLDLAKLARHQVVVEQVHA